MATAHFAPRHAKWHRLRKIDVDVTPQTHALSIFVQLVTTLGVVSARI
jgi:hypothetical protein